MESSSLLIALAIVCFCLFFLRVSDVQYDIRNDSSTAATFFSCRSLSLPIASICYDPPNMWYKSSKVRTKVNVNICTSFSLTWPCLQEMDSWRVVIKVLHLISRCWLSVGRLNESCKLLRTELNLSLFPLITSLSKWSVAIFSQSLIIRMHSSS